MVALRDKQLRELAADPGRAVLRLLCDRRDELSPARAQALNRLHRLFAELLPGGAPVKKSVSQYKTLLASVRPRDPAGKVRRRMAAEELAGLDRLDARLKAMKAELKTAVLATGSQLMDIHGIGPAGAARILADVGDIARFPHRAHFASWTGTAPIDASSGQHTHHRLSRAGNRRLNHVLHMAGIVQLRHDTPGRASCRRRITDGKTPMEAMRCPRRRLSDAVYRQLAADAQARQAPGRALRGGSVIQRGRPSPGHRHFGPATSRTRTRDPTPAASSAGNPSAPAQLPPHAGAPEASTCSARSAPARGRTTLTPTSAGVTQQRGSVLLTSGVIEGSHVRKAHHCRSRLVCAAE